MADAELVQMMVAYDKLTVLLSKIKPNRDLYEYDCYNNHGKETILCRMSTNKIGEYHIFEIFYEDVKDYISKEDFDFIMETL